MHFAVAAHDTSIVMRAMEISDQLRQARIARGEELPALAARIGVRQEHLRAIEDGRFGDLPSGIYGRSAVRSFASAMGLDGPAVLAECEPFLAPLEEPIAGLARVRGIRERPASVARTRPPFEQAPDTSGESPFAGWRAPAAAVLDACAIAALLLLVIIAAMTVLTVPPSALRSAGGAFAMMGALIAAGYYCWFGGVAGATWGERALAVEPHEPARLVTLRLVCDRAILAATRDVRGIHAAGERFGRSTAAWASRITGEAKG